MGERFVIISDTQIPYDDRRALTAVVGFIGAYQPDQVIHIGNLLDYPTPARWTKGTADEFAQRIKPDAEQAKARFLGPLREVYDGPVGIHEGNHDERPRTYLAKYAPALAESGAFNIETLLNFDGFDITLLPEFYKVAPGWITTHGHRGGVRLSQIAGNTALNAARKFNTSVVMGHTHRMGIGSETRGYGGNISKTVTGMEVGNLMNMKLATYLKGSTANWQQGFGILTIDGNHVTPTAVSISRGCFTVNGDTWEV